MTRKKIPILFTLLILSTLFIAASLGPSATPLTPSSSNQVRPQRDPALPANQTGNGYPMSFEEYVYGWQANATVKANNTLSSYQQRNAPPFTEPTPSPYTKGPQYLTVSNLAASQDVREVQYASSSVNSLIANDTGIGTYAQLAMRFRSIEKANLTGIWIYYTSAGTANLHIINSSTNSGDKKPEGRPTIATYTLLSAVQGWHFVKFSNPVTMQAGFYYWVCVNATGMGITLVQWFYIADAGGVEDNKCASAYSGGWLTEANLIGSGKPYLNFMLMLDVLPVNPANPSQVRTYSSPPQVAMNETNSNTQLGSGATLIPAAYSTFALRANTSVTFAVNWTAEFAHLHLYEVSASYVARDGSTQWTVNFTSDAKPNPTTYPYTWFNRMFRITTIPQFWNGTAHPPTIWNNQSYSPSPSFTNGSGYYQITQMNNINTDPWNAKWGISVKSIYKITATLPSQVVAGLPLTLTVDTTPYTQSWCNVTFYNATGYISYTRNVTIPSTSQPVTLKLNDTGVHTLFLFDRWTLGNEASLNKTLTINVLQPNCNITVVDRSSPVIGNGAGLKFRFYNNSLGMGNTVIQPQAVSINGTPTSFDYNAPSGNTTAYMSTFSGGWHTGNNTIIVSAKSGVFNATKQTWIFVLEPLCNITVVGRTSPVIGNAAGLQFKFYNNSLGTGNSVIHPDVVSVNKTSYPFTYNDSTGVVSVSWSTALPGWHVGNNTVSLSADQGDYFSSTLKTWILIQGPLCNVTFTSFTQTFPPGNIASLSFKFYNNTVGANPLLINPTSVKINGTNASFIYSGGVVTANWSILTGNWHLGLNHVNVSATKGIFTNFAVVPITLFSPLCNVTLFGSISSPILGNLATAQFKFLNGTYGWAAMQPTTVKINGTTRTINYGSGIATVSWDTSSGKWHSGLNHVNITAISGVFLNSTVYQFTIIAPNASLVVNSIAYSATYGDDILIGLKFLNTTLGTSQPFPSPPTLYRNGTAFSLTDLGGGNYTYSFNTRYFPQAGVFHINFTAKYGNFYVATNITAFVISKIPMTVALHLDQTSVTAGSSLSTSATLSYNNGTLVEDGIEIVFTFTVKYANSTVRAFDVTSLTLSGTCHAAFTATSQMSNISVEAIFGGDGIRASASDSKSPITVTQPTGGFPVIVVAGAGGIGALVVGLSVVAVRRRRRGKEIEYKKTAALRQAASLAQLVVVDRKSGRAVFSKNLSTEEAVDPHLISGFLSANESIMQEVFRGDKECLRYADYGKYQVITCAGEYVMTTLFLAAGSRKQLEGVLELEDVLSKFNREFEKKYGRLVSVWDGDMVAFRGAESIVSEVFAQGISMLSPYTLDTVALARTKLSGLENDAFERASRLSAGRGVFFITKVMEYLLSEKGVSRGKLMDIINSLVKKGVFKQISMSEAEQIIAQAASGGTAT